jgi:hypothetical protein
VKEEADWVAQEQDSRQRQCMDETAETVSLASKLHRGRPNEVLLIGQESYEASFSSCSARREDWQSLDGDMGGHGKRSRACEVSEQSAQADELE